MVTCIHTRGQLAACIYYTRPIVFTPQMATWPVRHVAIWPRVYSNRYCRHVAICGVFCSVTVVGEEEFYDYLDPWDRRFYATSLSEGGPPCCRRGRNFTTIPIRGINALLGHLSSHGRWCSWMELYLSSCLSRKMAVSDGSWTQTLLSWRDKKLVKSILKSSCKYIDEAESLAIWKPICYCCCCMRSDQG